MYQNFLKNGNLTMLLEVLLDELKVSKNPINVENARQIFLNNIKFFTKNPRPNMQLNELNKLFLKQVMMAINALAPKKINILNENINFPYKAEDIQEMNSEIINDEFNIKKKDFERYSNKKPDDINFSDNVKLDKIKNMEELINIKLNEREIDEFPPLPEPIVKNKQKSVSFVDEQQKQEEPMQMQMQMQKETSYEEQKSATLPIQEKEIIVTKDMQLKYKQLIDAKSAVNMPSLSDEIARMNERMASIEDKLNVIGEQLSALCGGKLSGNWGQSGGNVA